MPCSCPCPAGHSAGEPHQNVERGIVIRVHLQGAALTMKQRLALPVGSRDLPAVMAGLAGVPRVHGFKVSTLVAQALGQLAPVAG